GPGGGPRGARRAGRPGRAAARRRARAGGGGARPASGGGVARAPRGVRAYCFPSGCGSLGAAATEPRRHAPARVRHGRGAEGLHCKKGETGVGGGGGSAARTRVGPAVVSRATSRGAPPLRPSHRKFGLFAFSTKGTSRHVSGPKFPCSGL